MQLDSAHAPRQLGLHTASVLLAELDATECACTNYEEEKSGPDTGDGESDQRDLSQGLSWYHEGGGTLCCG